jgi:NADH:ubiquinone oxidoreductase subunit F (NADH-binding)
VTAPAYNNFPYNGAGYLGSAAVLLLDETLAPVDTIEKLSTIVRTESCDLSESISKGVDLSRTEGVTLADLVAKSFGQSMAESLASMDSLGLLCEFVRTFFEFADSLDETSKQVQQIRTDTLRTNDWVHVQNKKSEKWSD